MSPAITIGIIGYDLSDELLRTLESLKQVPDDCEVVIQISQCDPRQLEDFVEQARSGLNISNVRALQPGDSGIYNAMNRIRSSATGRYLWYLNAGDDMHPARSLPEVTSLLTEQTCYGFRSEQLFAQDVYLRPRAAETDPSFARIGHQSTIYVADAFRAHAFNERLPVSADLEFNHACFGQTGMRYVPMTLSRFRLGGVSNRFRMSDLGLFRGESFRLRCGIFAKACLRLLVGQRLMYRILAYGKYDHRVVTSDR